MPRELEFEEHGIRGYYTCSKCKAPIAGEHFDEHRQFHAEIDELIEWAQAVSVIFKRKAFPDAQEG